jgi:flagellar hook-length control protein FliK
VSVVSEASAARHAHLGQGPRSSSTSADATDQTSPFAALLDDPSDTSASPTSASPTSPPLGSPVPPPPSQKVAVRPPDSRATPSSTSESAPRPPTSPPAGSASQNPTTAASSSPSKVPQGPDSTDTVLALAALAKKTARNAAATDPAVGTTADSVPNGTAQPPPIDLADASSTAAAIIGLHGGDKTEKSDSGASDSAPAATPPADPSANQPIAAPQPVAVPISAPAMPALPATSLNAGDDGDGQDAAAQIAALGDALKAGRAGKAAAAPVGGAKPGPKSADVAAPSPTPQPGQDDPSSTNGPGQPNATDAAQSRNADGSPATEAAANQARQRAASNQQSDGSAAAQDNSNGNSAGNANLDSNGNPNAVDPNGDPKRDLSGSTNRIEDITRLALDPSVRHVESSTAETASGAPAHPGSGEAANAQPAPDGALAPAILTTAAAPATAAATAATPAAIPIAGLAVEIASQAHAGKNRFEIRLDPPDLGRIDVRLDVDRDGKVTSRLIVDRPETLDILRKDAPQLERSLQQAGLKTADDALQFSLRDQSGGSGNQNPYSGDGAPTGPTRVIIPDAQLPPVEAVTATYGRVVGRSTGVDIRV